MNKKSVLMLLLCGSILGFQGCKPEQGNPGPQGVQGDAGKNGTNGTNGPTGPKGVTGDKGATGDKGPIGATGSASRSTDWKPLVFEFKREEVLFGQKTAYFEAIFNENTLDKNTVENSIFDSYIKNNSSTVMPFPITTFYSSYSKTAQSLPSDLSSNGNVNIAIFSVKEGQLKVYVRVTNYSAYTIEKLQNGLNGEKIQMKLNIIAIPKG